MNGLVVCYTMCARTQEHPHIYLHIYSQDKRTNNQIDHIMLNNRKKRSAIDARTYRYADINSNHMFMLVIIKLKLRAMRKVHGRRKLR